VACVRGRRMALSHLRGRMTLRAVPWPRATLRILDGLDASAAQAPPDSLAVSA
jgi:hypothetical protein